MRILLDTHVFLWLITGDSRMPPAFRSAIQDSNNQVFLSIASIWEAVIKYSLKKLVLPGPPSTYLPRQREEHHIASLLIDEQTFPHLAQLPSLHRDPFDRILIAQALANGLLLASVDPSIIAYGSPLLSELGS